MQGTRIVQECEGSEREMGAVHILWQDWVYFGPGGGGGSGGGGGDDVADREQAGHPPYLS